MSDADLNVGEGRGLSEEAYVRTLELLKSLAQTQGGPQAEVTLRNRAVIAGAMAAVVTMFWRLRPNGWGFTQAMSGLHRMVDGYLVQVEVAEPAKGDDG